MLLFSLILIFLGTFWLPLLPGLFEILRPADARSLPLDRKYSRTPLFFAESFRRKIAQDALRRKSERTRLENDMVVAPGGNERDVVLASGRVLVNDGARLTDIVSQGDLFVGNDVRARVLSSAKSLHIGDRCVVDRWAHADGDLVVGSASSAGAALTAHGTLSLHGNVRFQRAFGMPIRAAGVTASDVARTASRSARIIPDGSTVAGNLICNGDLVIGKGCTLQGSVKAHGAVFVGANSRIEGNIVARKDVVVGANVAIRGHIFTEYQAMLGAGSSVGTKDAHKSVYSRMRVALHDGAVVWGAIINELETARPGKVAVSAMLIGGLFAAAALFTPAPVDAAESGPTITLQQTNAIYSPSTYGNESITTLSTRVPAGQNQPGLSLASGSGSVLSPGASSGEIVVDDYLQFSKSSFAYASVLAGKGAIFPSSGAYAEFDATLHSHWSGAAGAGFYTFNNGVRETYASIGPTYYFTDGNVSLRAVPQWFARSGNAVALQLAAQYGRQGHWIASVRAENGLDPAIVGQAPFLLAPAEHGNAVILQWQQWLTPHAGIVVGAESENETNRTTTQPLYTRQALTFGLFVTPGH